MTTRDTKQATQETLAEWRKQEKRAILLLRTVAELRFDKGVELVMFRQDLYDVRPSDVIYHHRLAESYIGRALTIDESLDMAKAIQNWAGLRPMKVDIGILLCDYVNGGGTDLEGFIHDKLGSLSGGQTHGERDVVLYGFGRIGRLLARRIISTTGRGDQLRLRAIVVRPKMKSAKDEMEKRAALLMDDSIHGRFPGVVDIDAEAKTMTVNGSRIHFIFAGSPEDVDYTDYGIRDALVIDNTGMFRDKEGLSRHLRPGASQVMLTAPGDDVPNIVYGVNQEEALQNGPDVISAASCTTNAIVPVIKVLDDAIGIDEGHIETVHAYTSDQNLLDNFHKKPRRGRGAATNMVLTSTGAAKAVAKVMPHLAGSLTGNAVRVPTPDVSIAIMNFSLKDSVTVEHINDLLKQASLHGSLVEQIHYSTSSEFVSSNAIGMTSTSVLDAPSTIVSKDGRRATVYAWYDNEYGYTCQVVRLAKYFARVRRPVYY